MKLLSLTAILLLQAFNLCAQQPQVILPIGHTNMVNTSVFSKEGKLVVTAASDNTAKVWETFTGRLIATFPSKTIVNTASFSPDGKYLVTGLANNAVDIWHIASGKKIQTFQGRTEGGNGEEGCREVLLTTNAKYVLINFEYNEVKVFGVASRKLIASFKGDTTMVRFSADEKYIINTISNGTDLLYEYYDILSGKKIKTTRVAYSIDGQYSPAKNYVITADANHRGKMWSTKTGKWLYDLPGTVTTFFGITFSDNERYAVLPPAGNNDSNYIVIEPGTGQVVCSIALPPSVKNTIRFSPGGNYLVTGSVNNNTQLWETSTGKLIADIDGTVYLNSAAFSNDGKYFTLAYDRLAGVWATATGNKISDLQGASVGVKNAIFSKNNDHIITAHEDGTVKLWDLRSGRMLRNMDDHSDAIISMRLSNNGRLILAASRDSTVSLFNAETGKLISTIYSHSELSAAELSPDGKYIVTIAWDSLKLWTAAGEFITALEKGSDELKTIRFTPSGRFIYTLSYESLNSWQGTDIWEVPSGKWLLGEEAASAIKEIKKQSDKIYVPVQQAEYAEYSGNGKYIAVIQGVDNKDGYIYEVASGKLVQRLKGHSCVVLSASFSNDAAKIITTSCDNTARIWDLATGKFIVALTGHTASVLSAHFSADGKYIVTTAMDNTIKVWKANGELLYSFFTTGNEDFFSWLPSPSGIKYYSATKNASKLISFRADEKIFSFDQFDIQYNRPDKLMEALSYPDTATISLYRDAWFKRLKRAGVKQPGTAGFDQPTIEILNTDTLPAITGRNFIQVHFKASSHQKLDRYYTYVNEIPVQGINGYPLRYRNISVFDTSITIELSPGMNKVQITCMNETGIESPREVFYITWQPEKQVQQYVYFVGIGLSNYKDSTRNLQYGVKDVHDLDSIFRKRYGAYYRSRILVNDTAIKENILAAKSFLNTASVNDIVIASFSGHGILSNKEFYFGSYDIDFDHPSARGVLYDSIAGLLDGIAARYKLLFIDACHSGEVDTDVYTEADTTGKNVKVYKGVTIKTKPGATSAQRSFELMKELFADLSRSNGAVIISAASALQYAYEDADYSNGLFTYCIKKGLAKNAADENDDGLISINELKEYVSREVLQLSAGKQKPTIRQENIAFDWLVW